MALRAQFEQTQIINKKAYLINGTVVIVMHCNLRPPNVSPVILTFNYEAKANRTTAGPRTLFFSDAEKNEKNSNRTKHKPCTHRIRGESELCVPTAEDATPVTLLVTAARLRARDLLWNMHATPTMTRS